MTDKDIEEYSPFVVAKKQGIYLDYCYLGSGIVGIYADLNGIQIILNSGMDNDRQEDAVQLLIEHHLTNRGVERSVHKNELNKLNGLRIELSRLNKIFVNGLIMRKIQLNEK